MSGFLVSVDEERILKEYKDTTRHLLIRKKSEAVLLAAAGVTTGVVAGFVSRQESTIKQWLRDWQATRLASIITGHAGNLNASKLTAEQRQEVCRILSNPPSDQGLPAQFWAVEHLKDWLKAKFDVVYESDTSYHFLLHLAGLSFHQPEPFDHRRANDAAIDARMAQIRAEIAPMLLDTKTLVYAADEVRLQQEAIVRRAWYKQNTKTKLLVDRVRDAQNYIGFLNQNTGRCELIRLDWQNGPTIIAALKQLAAKHRGKKIVIVWDSAAWHKTKDLRELLAADKPLHNVHLIALPPYAPDRNPIEHVWKDTKDHIANIQRFPFEQTRLAFEHHVASRRFNYRI